MTDFTYVGSELPLFEKARNWKAYYRSRIAPFLKGEVLEVGAGIGANTRLFAGEGFDKWVCLEPDAALHPALAASPDGGGRRELIVGTLGDLPPQRLFDAILYIDVLEHIEDDRAEMALAASRLRPGGHLIVLSPAHQWLYSPFDKSIGHYRRYSRAALAAAAPPGLACVSSIYMDAVGMLASTANRLLLSQSMPTEKQILFWDNAMVPVSRILDPLFFRRVGKSVLGVWKRPAPDA